MTLYEKIRQIYTELTINDFTTDGTILLAMDEEGNEVVFNNSFSKFLAERSHI
jgi:hypothetical protein